MRTHQAAGLRRVVQSPSAPQSIPVLGLASGKGGVGKSTLAVNLAVAAAARGARVLLIDGDVGLANADLLMGLVPRCDLGDWIEGRVSLEQAVCRGPAGLSLLLAGESARALDALADVLSGGGAAGLGPFLARHDLVVLDLGAGIGGRVIELASACRPLWLVATPEPTSLADAYATAKRLWEQNPELQIELLVNRASSFADGERTHQALARLTRRFLGRPLSLRGSLPEEAELIRSVARQTPLVLASGQTPASRRIGLLAESILEERGTERACARALRAGP